jgi:hypothetical protein
MSLPNQPSWACPEWGPDHYWHDCEDCLEQYELMIEKAQGGWEEEDPVEQEPVEQETAMKQP